MNENEIIKCKNCEFYKDKHYEEDGEQPYIKHTCQILKIQVQEDDFCAWAQAKKQTQSPTYKSEEIAKQVYSFLNLWEASGIKNKLEAEQKTKLEKAPETIMIQNDECPVYYDFEDVKKELGTCDINDDVLKPIKNMTDFFEFLEKENEALGSDPTYTVSGENHNACWAFNVYDFEKVDFNDQDVLDDFYFGQCCFVRDANHKLWVIWYDVD